VALDVHRDFCEVAIVAEGRLRSAGRIEARPEALELFGQSLDARDWVALEVTGNAWEIARILEPHVARVIVVSPSDTGIRQARAKTERLDARALARLRWAGELDGVWAPDRPPASIYSASTAAAGWPSSSSRSSSARRSIRPCARSSSPTGASATPGRASHGSSSEQVARQTTGPKSAL
jgi:hypothetical protein